MAKKKKNNAQFEVVSFRVAILDTLFFYLQMNPMNGLYLTQEQYCSLVRKALFRATLEFLSNRNRLLVHTIVGLSLSRRWRNFWPGMLFLFLITRQASLKLW